MVSTIYARAYPSYLKPAGSIGHESASCVPCNLSIYFEVFRLEISDSTAWEKNLPELYSIIREERLRQSAGGSFYDDLKRMKWSIYTVVYHENLIFYFAAGGELMHPAFYNIVYNEITGKYYDLMAMSDSKINELLESEKYPFTDDAFVLQYAFLISKMKNPLKAIKIIGSLKDLAIQEALRYPLLADLDNYKHYDTEIEFPQISRTGDEIEVTFYLFRKGLLGKDNNISKVYIKLKDSKLIEYEEKLITYFY